MARVDPLRAAALVAWLLCSAVACSAQEALRGQPPGAPARIVSVNPSLTSILLALDAGSLLVGVDDYSARQQPALARLPRVGGLRDTSLEAVVALEPDLVVLVPSAEQREFRAGLARLGVPQLSLDPVTFDDVLAAIEILGARVARESNAQQCVAAIRRARAGLEQRSRHWPRLRGVLVLTREPLFVVGRGSFIDEMLDVIGVDNLGRSVGGVYPRVGLEWLLAQAPELIVDAAGGDARSFWSRWPSLPAVRDGRLVSIPQGVATLPGPHLDQALETLARAVRGPLRAGSGGP